MNHFVALPLVALVMGVLPGNVLAGTYSIELWVLEAPANAVTATLPEPGRLVPSSTAAEAWMADFGGGTGVATHLVLDLADAEDFSIELPALGCAFHGQGTVQPGPGGIRFDLVSLDSPERDRPDCSRDGGIVPDLLPAGKASARQTRFQAADGQTLVFAPANRADGRRRVILWRTVVK
jgi:hypothetical protein